METFVIAEGKEASVASYLDFERSIAYDSSCQDYQMSTASSATCLGQLVGIGCASQFIEAMFARIAPSFEDYITEASSSKGNVYRCLS